MPPKAKYNTKEIVQIALNLVRRKGADALTARGLAKAMGTSTGPIFVGFNSMDEIRQLVLQSARKMMSKRLKHSGEYDNYLTGLCLEYIQFASKEPYLYEMLYRSEDENGNPCGSFHLFLEQNLFNSSAFEQLKATYHLSDTAARKVVHNTLTVCHGIACLCAANAIQYDQEALEKMLNESCLCQLYTYRNIPGLIDGTADVKQLLTEERAQ